MDNQKKLWVGILVVLVIAIGAYFYPSTGKFFGAISGETNYNVLGISGLKLGSTCNNSFGSSGCQTINQFRAGTCYIKPYASTIAASTTALVDCQGTAAIGSITGGTSALTGVVSGDIVSVQLSTTTSAFGGLSNGIVVIGAAASSTSGYIQLNISNLTGGTFTWPQTGTASGTATYIDIN